MTARWLAIAVSAAALTWAGAHVLVLAMHWSYVLPLLGVDYRILMGAADHWLQGGGFYLPFQLAGPYDIAAMNDAGTPPIMYPPTMLLLLVPFTVIPWILWWAIPIGVTAAVVWHHRPRWPSWPVLALLVAFPSTLTAIETGNPTLWFTMAVALGTVYGWPAVLLILKPTIAPLALIGIGHRAWWVALAAVVVASLLFLPMWPAYLEVLANTGNAAGVLYSLHLFPTLLIPVVAWLGSSSSPALPDLGRVVHALRRLRGTGGLRMAWPQP